MSKFQRKFISLHFQIVWNISKTLFLESNFFWKILLGRSSSISFKNFWESYFMTISWNIWAPSIFPNWGREGCPAGGKGVGTLAQISRFWLPRVTEVWKKTPGHLNNSTHQDRWAGTLFLLGSLWSCLSG